MPGGLVLGGDGRNDSPGHSAKYGSYTVMEGRLNKVIHIELVQVQSFVMMMCRANSILGTLGKILHQAKVEGQTCYM